MQIPSVTLKEAAVQFKVWHQNKCNKFEPIPPNLKDLVKHLLLNYHKKEIMTSLGISNPTISSIQKQTIPSINQPTKQDINFIPFQVTSESALTTLDESTPMPTKQDNVTCQIIKTDGTKLIIQTSDSKTIIEAFLCYN